MTQPDLVSKLRELQPHLRRYVTWCGPVHSQNCPADDTCDCEWKDTLAAINLLCGESLLGLEGQAAETIIEIDEEGKVHGDISGLRAPCGPSQPETVREGYKGICVCGHRSGAHHESDPSCEFCACKSYRDVSAWGGSPSTPIVPGTAGLSAEQVQAAIVPLLETDALLTVIPWKKIADRLNALLGAAKPIGISIDALEDLMQQFKQREAKIRKSVLEEAAQVAEVTWLNSFGPINEKIKRVFVAIRALAERPAPAGEVSKGERQ